MLSMDDRWLSMDPRGELETDFERNEMDIFELKLRFFGDDCDMLLHAQLYA